MKLLYTIILTLIMLFIITFSLVNTSPVQLKYYGFIDVSVAAYMLIFISFGIGIIFAGFMGIVERFRLSREVAKLKKKIKVLDRKISNEKLPAIQETKAEETTSWWSS